MADLLDQIRSDLDARLAELRPLVQEAASLEAALEALGNSGGAAGTRGSTAPRRRRGARSATRRRRRGESRELVIDYVRSHPGSTAGDVAKALGLNRNSVATRLAQLGKSGELVKAQRGYSAP
jgi:CRP-like cAMP-binding protein